MHCMSFDGSIHLINMFFSTSSYTFIDAPQGGFNRVASMPIQEENKKVRPLSPRSETRYVFFL